MALLPFSEPLKPYALITTACHLYRQSIVKALPISFLIVLLSHFVRFGADYVPKGYANLTIKVSVVLLILIVPLMGALITLMDKIGKAQPLSYKEIITYMIARFLSLAGCILSMVLFPAIVLGIGIAIYFVLGMKHAPIMIIFGWKVLIPFLVLLVLTPKMIAPILVFTNEQDANTAIDNSANLIKGHYWATYLYSLYAIVLCLLLANIPAIIQGYGLIVEAIAEILLVIIGPWAFALLVVHKYNLEFMTKEKNGSVEKKQLKNGIGNTNETPKNTDISF